MESLDHLFKRNAQWAESVKHENSDFFQELSKQQTPPYLWIGCSDSRVSANHIVDLPPGQIFVHRNIANLVIEDDLNCLSVIQYAVEVLQVKHIIICGHYGCGGVAAALGEQSFGRIDNWLAHIKQVARSNETKLEGLDQDEKSDLLCELNVKAQVANMCNTDIIRKSWKNGQELSVHGLIYNLENGLLDDLGTTVSSLQEFKELTQ